MMWLWLWSNYEFHSLVVFVRGLVLHEDNHEHFGSLLRRNSLAAVDIEVLQCCRLGGESVFHVFVCLNQFPAFSSYEQLMQYGHHQKYTYMRIVIVLVVNQPRLVYKIFALARGARAPMEALFGIDMHKHSTCCLYRARKCGIWDQPSKSASLRNWR